MVMDQLTTFPPTGSFRDSRAHRLFKIAVATSVTAWIASFVPKSQAFQLGLILFVATFAIAWLATHSTAFGEGAASLLNRFADFMERRGAFRSNPQVEVPKFALIRAGFGLLLMQRALWIVYYLAPADWNDPLLLFFVFAGLVAAFFVFAGFLTQYSLAFLVLLQWQSGDVVMQTFTLGNYIAAMLALLLMFANAGAHLSVDGWLARRWPAAAWSMLSYYPDGLPPARTLQIAKFLTLLCYWCVCIYSLMTHLSEEAWMTGAAGPLLLASSFVSRYHEQFAAFFELGPWAVLVGKIGLWGMLPWYALLLPLVLAGGVWRSYALIWAVLFFCLSLFVLQLGWLAHFEFLLLAGLFWQSSFIDRPRTLQVAYDDRCNLCDNTVRFIKRVDIFRRVELRPLSTNLDWLASHGIDATSASTDLYGIDGSRGDRKYCGYDFYIALSRNLLLLLPLYIPLLIGKWTGIGPAIYRFIADRRTRYFGVCELPRHKHEYRFVPSGRLANDRIVRADPIVPTSLHIVFLASVYLVTAPALFAGWRGVPLPTPLASAASAAAHIYGIGAINVFNRSDLALSENWFTLSTVDAAGKETLLPLTSITGTRLPMHNSDRVYFGKTGIFRRATIGKEGCFFEKYASMMVYLASGFADQASDKPTNFIYRQYHQPLPDFDAVVAGIFGVQPASERCSQIFVVPAASSATRSSVAR